MADRLDDEGRDLRAALGGLLTDEPTQPWSVHDDVRRGQALRSRRRTRALGAVGAVAALALVAAVVGPLRPGPVTVPPGGSAPSVPGVSPAWFAGITPALLDRITGVVDWDRSTVRGSASEGFLADLTIVPVAVTMNGEDRTVELLSGDGRTGRLTLQWMPGRTSPGPALARCPVAVCPEQGPTGVVGGQRDMGATAGPDAGFPEGTVIIDRQYPQGLLELVDYPSVPPAALPPSVRDWAVMPGVVATEFLTDLGNPVSSPSPTSSVSDRACTSGQVKLIAEPDSAPASAGVTTVRVRVIPRNPEVSCVLQGTPQVTLLDADGTALGYRQVVGSTGDPVRLASGVEGSFRVSRTVCASAGTDVATLRVGLPGGGAPADVSVVAFSPLVSCATASPDNDVLVSTFEQG